MSVLLEVAPSGTVGKQLFSSSQRAEMCAFVLVANTSAAVAVVKHGNASGETVLTVRVPAGDTFQVQDTEMEFSRGMHVKVTPADALAYLQLD